MNDNGVDTTTQNTGTTVPAAPQMPHVEPAVSVPPFQPQPMAQSEPQPQLNTQSSAPVAPMSFSAASSLGSTPPPPFTPSFTSPLSSSPSPVPGSASWGTSTTPTWTPPVVPPSMTPPPPVMNTSNDFKPEHEGKSKLPLLIAGILLILAMAGAYFLYMLYQTPTTIPPVVQETVSPTVAPSPTMTEDEKAQQDIDQLENVSKSDEVEAIQKDVDDTNLSTIDSALTPSPTK